MKRKIFYLFALIFIFLPILAVQAQVQPTSGVIPFSGTIPAQPDGPVALRLRLFPTASGPGFCFEETQTVQVTTEAFSVFIGDGTVGGIPPNPCFTTNTSLWIAFALDGSPDVEIGGRAAITSSGYAHFAQKVAQGPGSGLDADTLQGLGPAAFAAASHTHPGSDITSAVATANAANTANNALNIADGTVTTPKIVDGAVTGPKLAPDSVGSSKIVDEAVTILKIAPNSVNASRVVSTDIQLRVTPGCPAGNAIRVVNQDGTVTCQPTGGGAGVTAVTASEPLVSSGGATPNISLPGVIIGGSNTAIGAGALPSSTGDNNTAIGVNALFFNSTGVFNTASGVNALAGNFTGSSNTASGFNALFFNSTGNFNTASGVDALSSNTTGGRNTAIGVSALRDNTTIAGVSGHENTAIGAFALQSNTTGDSNTASGVNALFSNTTGRDNTASGFRALFGNTEGDKNTASGRSALQNNTMGAGNTAVGQNALDLNTTGSQNTAIGADANVSMGNLTNVTAIGAGAIVNASNATAIGAGASSGSNSTAIGAGAIASGSNTIRLGNAQVTSVSTSGKVSASGGLETSGKVSASGDLISLSGKVIATEVNVSGDLRSLFGKVVASGFNGFCTTVFVPAGGGSVNISCNQDVAETFGSLEVTEPGDLVVLVNQSASMPTVRKSTRPYEGLLVGAVSTSPGLVFDRGETLLAGDNSKLITPEKTVVGLVGRVPVKVSLENGPIAVGDPLTSSSTEGVAMKATKAGQIVGYALEKADQKGKILVHLQPGYYIPPKQLALLNQIDELKAQLSELQGLFQAVLARRLEESASDVAKREVYEKARLIIKAGEGNQRPQ